MKSIRVVQYGLGPIGCEIVRALLAKEDVYVVGAIDIDPEKSGRDLGEVLGLAGKMGVAVSQDAPSVLKKARPHVIMHATRPLLKDVYDQLALAAKAGIDVVSSTEELMYPHLRNPAPARSLDRLARKGGATILGTGVNPGFVMDTLALVLSGVSRNINSIRIFRRLDASTRRMSLQRRIGAGMQPAEFTKLMRKGMMGHIGLLDSMYLIALGLEWKLSRHTEEIEPVLAESELSTKYFTVRPGEVAGIKHTVTGYSAGRRVIDLDLRAYLGASDPMDRVEIEGDPRLMLTIPGGIPGDAAAVASLVNAIPRVMESEPGLKTVLDLPIPRAFRAV